MGIEKILKPRSRSERVRLFSREGLNDTWSIIQIWVSARILMHPSHSARYTLGALVITVLICLLLSTEALTLLTILATVYIVMELLDRFAKSRRRSFEGGSFQDFEKLDNSQRVLVYKRKQLWAQRLFASYLQTELDKKKYLQFVVEYGQWGIPPYEHLRAKEFADWGHVRIREFKDFGPSGESIINDVLSISPYGRGNAVDAVENVVAAVDMMVEQWECMARWILRCRSVLVHDSIEELPRNLSTLGMDMFSTIRDLPSDLIAAIDEAVEGLGRYGGECNVTVTMGADADEFSRAAQEIIESGRLAEAIVSEL